MEQVLHDRMGVALAALLLAGTSVAGTHSIKHYDIHVTPDFSTHTVRVVTRIRIQDPEKATRFEFAWNGNVPASLTQSSAPGKLEADDRGIAVTLDHPRTNVDLQFDYQLPEAKSRGEERSIVDDDSLFLLWSDRWYPIDFDRWAPVKTTISVPNGYKCIAPGRIVADTRMGTTRTFVFEERNPATSFSVFCDRRWVEQNRTIGRSQIRTLLHPEAAKWADRIFETSPDVLQFMMELHGLYPYEQFGFVTLTGLGGRRAFDGFVGYSPEYLDTEMTHTGYDAHETSLLWWGLTTRGSGPGSWQWTEGFGDYAEVLYAEARNKPLASIFGWFREQYLNTLPEQDVHYLDLRGNTPQKLIHGKYPYLLHVLRLGIGDDAFQRGIRLLFRRFAHQTFTMAEFVATFEQASGQDLKWWRDQWLNARGALSAGFTWQASQEGGVFRTKAILTQKGPSRRVPAEIGVRTAKGMTVRRVVFEPGADSLTFETATEPLEIVFDPYKRLPVRLIESADSVKPDR